MDKDEFERIKAEEKAHLRKLRDLERTHRDAQRTASSANALKAMRNRALEDETDGLTDGLMRDAAFQEARLDLALEGQAPVTGPDTEVDREALAKAEAEALVRQMKAAMGAGADTTTEEAARAADVPGAPEGAKTIGRTPPADEPLPADRGDKSIGRRRP